MSIHHGFIKEFPFIRVDNFSQTGPDTNGITTSAPQFYLLTHAHTDHVTGLDSIHFSGQIYCTPVTKHILLNTMEAGERVRYMEMPHGGKRRKFANLFRKNGAKSGRDLIKTIDINVPTVLQGREGPVTITALDANHCPGSCMFLIEGEHEGTRRSVIVTGDIRAETWWVNALRRNPLVEKYIHEYGDMRLKGKESDSDRWPVLDCIYLDNSCVGLNEDFLSKEEAVKDTVNLIAQYPADYKFFLNTWTWGYEDLLKGVAKAFNTRTHFDAYKEKIYHNSLIQKTDPLLYELGTSNTSHPNRFHACERRWKCDQVWADGRGCYVFAEEYVKHLESEKKFKTPIPGGAEDAKIVYVNPSAIPRGKWELYKKEMEKRLKSLKDREVEVGLSKGKRSAVDKEDDALLNHLICPISRHSPLPELQNFVSLFRPRTLYPLTINETGPRPYTAYLTLPDLFHKQLYPGGKERLRKESRAYVQAAMQRTGKSRLSLQSSEREAEREDTLDCFADGVEEFKEVRGEEVMTCLLNVEGGDAVTEMVKIWAKPNGRGGEDQPIASTSSPRKKAKLDVPTSSGTVYPLSETTSVQTSSALHPSPASNRPIPSLPLPPNSSLLFPSSSTSTSTSNPAPLLPSPNITREDRKGKSRALNQDEHVESPSRRNSQPSQSALAKLPRSPSHPLLLTKTVTFLSPTQSTPTPTNLSPELLPPSSTASSSPSSTSPRKLVQAPISSSSSNKRARGNGSTPKITARPSSATKGMRSLIAAALIKELGGKLGPNGVAKHQDWSLGSTGRRPGDGSSFETVSGSESQ